jgi:hypothetical protein
MGERRDEVIKSGSGRPMYRIAVRAKTVHFIVPRDELSEHMVHELKRQLTSTLEQVADAKALGHVSYTSSKTHAVSYEPVSVGA